MAAEENLLNKRIGYLTAGLCLSPDHEFRMMLVNRLHRVCAICDILREYSVLVVCRNISLTEFVWNHDRT